MLTERDKAEHGRAGLPKGDAPEHGRRVKVRFVIHGLDDLLALCPPNPVRRRIHQQTPPLAPRPELNVARSILALDDQRRFDRERVKEAKVNEGRDGGVDCRLIGGPGVREEREEVRGAVGREGVGVQAEGDGRPVQMRVKVLRLCRP